MCFQLKYQTSLSSIVASCRHVDTIPSRFLKLELDAFWQHLGQHRPDRLDSTDSTAKVLVMLGKVCYEKIQNCFVYTICLWQSLRKRKCNAIVLRSSCDASEPVSLHSFSVFVVTKQNISVALLLFVDLMTQRRKGIRTYEIFIVFIAAGEGATEEIPFKLSCIKIDLNLLQNYLGIYESQWFVHFPSICK